MISKNRKTQVNLPMDSSPEIYLPAISTVSPSVLSFLNSTFHPKHGLNLSDSTHLVVELDTHCSELTHRLIDLTRHLDSSLLSYTSSSDRISDAFHHIHHQIQDLKSKSSSFASSPDGKSEDLSADELPTLAKEVARVEMVRNYAETALKLDSLVGDIEDAVTSVMNRNLKKYPTRLYSEEIRFNAINSLKSIEDILASVTRAHPQWVRLVTAADHRVDQALAIQRPQAIADHRALLVSIGWPPPLSTSSSSNVEGRRISEVPNPLLAMHGELKQKYCKNFLALCSLQELQRRRKSRQLERYDLRSLYQPLWGIDELVNPLSLASLHHFQKWVDKPEFIFALVYKNTKDYIDSVDELLQPLVDEAKLTGYSCREEWISAMVTSLTTYLAKEIFPAYVSGLDDESIVEDRPQARISWLHLIDLMIAFDKKIQALAALSGISDTIEEFGLLRRMSSLSVFCDRPDWIHLWARIELYNIVEKLKPEMEDERNWSTKTQGALVLFPGSEDYKSPVASSIVLKHLSSVIDRCRSIPSVFLRSQFVRLVGAPIIQNFLNCLITKCLEAEGLTALADDDAVARVMTSINSAHHLESILIEWCDDIIFVEMGFADENESEKLFEDSSLLTGVTEGNGNGVLDEEITKLEEFRKEWINKLANVVSRGFDAQIRDYIKNKKQWQAKIEEGWTVTKSFVAALDFLQGKMSRLEGGLNGIDFATVWRSLAGGIDRLIFNGILMSNAKFYDGGVERFAGDMDVLFGVFRSWCLRPEGFFPRVSESLKLLKLEEIFLQDLFIQGEGWMKHNGIRHLSLTEAEKIARCRVFRH